MTTASLNNIATSDSSLHLNPLQQWEYFSKPRQMHEWLRDHYGDLAALHFQGRHYALAITPRAAQAVFTQDPDGYDAFWKQSFAGMNGEGSLWVLIGKQHRRERALFAPAVHAQYFRRYGEVIRDIAHARTEAWQPGATIRALDTTLAISLDVIMRLVFGLEDESTLEEGGRLMGALTQSAHPLIVFFPRLQRSWFPLFRRFLQAKVALYQWFRQVMAQRRLDGRQQTDVLGALMDARDDQDRPYADEHICNELLSVLTAGHITTATAMAWALYELGRHPEVLQKLRAELAAAGGDVDPVSVQSLPYLSAVCNETIRLHPILAECARVPMQPIEILGRTVPAGHALVVSIVGIHHDPAIYPEPDRFDPERFIEHKYSNYEFLPFGGGHRRCLGSGLAEFTLRIALADIARNWDFETASPDQDVRRDLAMGPKYGVRLRITERHIRAAA
ncbi:MAG TPA: cytochrome P450 [Anaerolineales bacterium]